MEAARQFLFSESIQCHKGMKTLDGNNNCTCIVQLKFTPVKAVYQHLG